MHTEAISGKKGYDVLTAVLSVGVNKRGIHKILIINTGGLIIYLFILSVISQSEFNYNIELIVSIGFFVCLTGFIDDRINLNPSSKIVLIIIAACDDKPCD